eukprot:4729224-Prymnesium_polylepis.1
MSMSHDASAFVLGSPSPFSVLGAVRCRSVATELVLEYSNSWTAHLIEPVLYGCGRATALYGCGRASAIALIRVVTRQLRP